MTSKMLGVVKILFLLVSNKKSIPFYFKLDERGFYDFIKKVVFLRAAKHRQTRFVMKNKKQILNHKKKNELWWVPKQHLIENQIVEEQLPEDS